MNLRPSSLLFILLLLVSCQTVKNEVLPAHCPIPIAKVMPLYPEILKKAGTEGAVELSVLVDENGLVTDVKIVKSIPVVASACSAAASKWKFKPGTIPDQNGNQIAHKFWFPISFDWSLVLGSAVE